MGMVLQWLLRGLQAGCPRDAVLAEAAERYTAQWGAPHRCAWDSERGAGVPAAPQRALVYASTAGVFWGDRPEPYHEFDPPHPANVYGVLKLAREQIVTALLRCFYIVRAGWVFGGGEKDRKFVGMITRKLLSGERLLCAVSDKISSPTSARIWCAGSTGCSRPDCTASTT